MRPTRETENMDFIDLCKSMRIVDGTTDKKNGKTILLLYKKICDNYNVRFWKRFIIIYYIYLVKSSDNLFFFETIKWYKLCYEDSSLRRTYFDIVYVMTYKHNYIGYFMASNNVVLDEDYIRQINSINQNTKQEGNITSVKKLITEVTATPGTEAYAEYSFDVSYDGNLMKKLIWAIIMPLIESLFSPQVMLLIIINYGLVGMVRLDSVMSTDMKLILNVLLNKMLGLIKQIIKFIKDKIVELLLTFFFEVILPLIVKYTSLSNTI